ncbi:attachment invasion locus protein [Xenorhabdus mauleonii]|uniref:Attachment invasion locus protein n=2 Tax=Xenorhabdus mauleonii TaxID=351675 RepID=A0A1I3TL65_9GAMM|nr:attachment invasion locus protein [Xenorhabdus mauleonii]SFJ71360.1 attachment invasion locus protein [Xenorhabdus mauleonii]
MTSLTANANGKHTISVGYAQSKFLSEEDKDIKAPKGANAKYRYEINEKLGIVSSLTRTSLKYTLTDHNDKYSHDFEHTSFMAGPSYRFNEYVSAYALLGAAYGKASGEFTEHHAYGYTQGRFEETATAAAYGAGVQFNPIPNVAIDVSYEYTKLDEAKLGTFVFGIGYRF